MIPPIVVQEIKRLLKDGRYSQRRIARMTGVSRGTVGAIATGKRPDYAVRRESEFEMPLPTGSPLRCPGCGGLVYMPCCACRVREVMTESNLKPWPGRPGQPARLELSDDQQKRYETVRTQALGQGVRRGGR